MRRIAVWIAFIIVVIIFAGTELGVEWNKSDKEKAAIISQEESLLIEGTVKSAKMTDEKCCRLTVNGIKTGNIVLTVYDAGRDMLLLPGVKIRAAVSPSIPEGAKNPGTFDYARYLESEEIFLTGSCDSGEIKTLEIDPNPFKGIVIKKAAEFRYGFYNSLSKRAGEDAAGLFAGMLFGDKSDLSSDTYESFQKNGTAHILSVSGLHVGIVYASIKAVFGKRKKSKAAALTSAIALFMMAVLASFSVSVVRAVIMIYIKIAADLLHRRYDLLSAACVTATFFLLKNPMTLYSTGFILSFSAVISLAVVGTGLDRMVKSKNAIWNVMLPIIAIQLGMAPMTALFFNYFSIAAFISNIPVIFLSGIMIPVGFVLSFMLLAGGGGDPLSNVVCDLCSKLSEMLVFFNDFTGAYGALSFSVCSPRAILMAVYYGILIMVFSEFRTIYPLRLKTVIIVCSSLAVISVLSIVVDFQKPQVVFLDVGQGDCIHIRTMEGKNYLVDGGGSVFSDYDVGKETIKPYLLKNGVGHLDGVFITHMDADHYKGISSLNEEFIIDNIYIYEGYRNCKEDLKKLLNIDSEETSLVWLAGGMAAELGKDVCMHILHPVCVNKLSFDEKSADDNTDFNANCLVMKLEYKNTDILFTGDITEKEEAEILDNCSCDIVKVPHHGSKYSSSEKFVKSLGARAAVIEVGKNNFGHPDKSVIERYEESGIMVYRTDEDGAVSLKINGTGCKISVQK